MYEGSHRQAHQEGGRRSSGGLAAPESTFADLYWSYRLLLQRPPEFSDETSFKRRCSVDLRTLVRSFVDCQEFRNLWSIGGGPKEPLPNLVVLTEQNGLRYWFSIRDRMIGQNIARGCYETDVTALVSQVVKPGMNCIDAGANLGYFSVLLGRLVGGDGRVYAFEPFPVNYDLLVRNIEENRLRNVVVPRQVAAYSNDSSGTLHFRADELNDNFGSMFLSERPQDGHLCRMTVPRAPLDDVVPEGLRIDVVKMDVEGAEVHALRGMSRILESYHPILIIEMNEQCLIRSGSTAEELLCLLEGFGYVLREIATDSGFLLSHPRWRDRHAVTNLVCRYSH